MLMSVSRDRVKDLINENRTVAPDKIEKMIDLILPRISPMMADGCGTVRDAVILSFDELLEGTRIAAQTHGSGFREE